MNTPDFRLQNTYCLNEFNGGIGHTFDQADVSCQTATGQCAYTCDQGYTKCPGVKGCFNPCPVQPTGTSRRARRYGRGAQTKQSGRLIDDQPGFLDASKPSVLVNSRPSLLGQPGSSCPLGLMACPVHGDKDQLECIDPLSDLYACGGCATPGGSGVRCDELEGVIHASCNGGKCTVCECTGLGH